MAERVNHPPHYNAGGIECIDALEAATSGLQGIEAFCTANAIKYLWRWKLKNGEEDLQKAVWYINRLIQRAGADSAAGKELFNMTQFNNELYAGFLPEAGDARFEGKRGFYPAMTAEEYRALPLPMKCATWDARVQYVIFDSYFRDYELSGKVEVHAENAFKALFRHSETDTQLYSVCAVRLFDGTRVAAKWVQDSVSGAFRIVTTSGNVLGTQGGFRGHIPENCKKRDDGTWGLFPLDRTADRKQIIRVAF